MNAQINTMFWDSVECNFITLNAISLNAVCHISQRWIPSISFLSWLFSTITCIISIEYLPTHTVSKDYFIVKKWVIKGIACLLKSPVCYYQFRTDQIRWCHLDTIFDQAHLPVDQIIVQDNTMPVTIIHNVIIRKWQQGVGGDSSISWNIHSNTIMTEIHEFHWFFQTISEKYRYFCC